MGQAGSHNPAFPFNPLPSPPPAAAATLAPSQTRRQTGPRHSNQPAVRLVDVLSRCRAQLRYRPGAQTAPSVSPHDSGLSLALSWQRLSLALSWQRLCAFHDGIAQSSFPKGRFLPL